MTELEAHQLLTLTQQLIDRQQLLGTMKKTHTERHFGSCLVTDGLSGLRMQRPLVETTAIWDSSSPDVAGSTVSWTQVKPPVLLKD